MKCENCSNDADYTIGEEHLIKAVDKRVLAALQNEPGEGWIERDWLIAQAEIEPDDDDLDTRIGAVADVLDRLEAAGYPTEMQREAAGDFYRLIPVSGLTKEEEIVADFLVQAWNCFVALNEQASPDHQERFQRAIHDAQGVLMERIAKRAYPKYWR